MLIAGSRPVKFPFLCVALLNVQSEVPLFVTAPVNICVGSLKLASVTTFSTLASVPGISYTLG